METSAMRDLHWPVEGALSCEDCLRQVPTSEAGQPEAQDYVLHFFGVACFDRWRSQVVDGDRR